MINRHLVGERLNRRNCSASEVALLSQLDWEGLCLLAARPQWVVFFGVSVFNHSLGLRESAHAESGSSGADEVFAVSKKSNQGERYLMADFLNLARSYFRDILGIELASTAEPRVETLLERIHCVVDQMLFASATGNYFDPSRALEAVYLLHCLVRGVKNKASLMFLRRFLLETLTSRSQARAFKQVVLLILGGVN